MISSAVELYLGCRSLCMQEDGMLSTDQMWAAVTAQWCICVSTLKLKPTSNSRIPRSHSEHTHKHTAHNTHSASHVSRFFTRGDGRAARGSFVADRVSLQCSQTHPAFCYHSVCSHFGFSFSHFFCFESCFVFKQTRQKIGKHSRWMYCTSTRSWERSQSQGR